MTKTDIYQSVTDAIIEALENGLTNKFELPWHGCSEIPQNAKTGNFYHGVNVPLLWVHQMKRNFVSGTWATYRQWQDMDAQVKKGQKGTKVVFWKTLETEPSADNEKSETRMFARWSTVFNADQVDGYELHKNVEPSDIQVIAVADALIDATGADIRHEEPRAYCNVTGDYINLPCPEIFKKTNASSATQNYYSTLFHELIHWTGANHRLDRADHKKFGDEIYAFEELIAELGSAMTCAFTGVSSTPREDHAQYIENWLKALKSDKRFIFAASSQAQKAVDYLSSLQEQVQEAA